MGFEYRIHSCNSGCEEPHVDEHRDDCFCEACHEGHKDEGMWLWDGFASCCTDEIALRLEEKTWCPKHRRPFADIANTWCAVCEEEKLAAEKTEGGHDDDRR